MLMLEKQPHVGQGTGCTAGHLCQRALKDQGRTGCGLRPGWCSADAR